MKVTLEKGEPLDIALIEQDRVVGTLSIVLNGSFGSKSSSRESARSSAPDLSSETLTKTGRKRRNISPEARARMADAQKRRWEKQRAAKGGKAAK